MTKRAILFYFTALTSWTPLLYASNSDTKISSTNSDTNNHTLVCRGTSPTTYKLNSRFQAHKQAFSNGMSALPSSTQMAFYSNIEFRAHDSSHCATDRSSCSISKRHYPFKRMVTLPFNPQETSGVIVRFALSQVISVIQLYDHSLSVVPGIFEAFENDLNNIVDSTQKSPPLKGDSLYRKALASSLALEAAHSYFCNNETREKAQKTYPNTIKFFENSILSKFSKGFQHARFKTRFPDYQIVYSGSQGIDPADVDNKSSNHSYRWSNLQLKENTNYFIQLDKDLANRLKKKNLKLEISKFPPVSPVDASGIGPRKQRMKIPPHSHIKDN